MYCPKCGQSQVSAEVRFCSRCGFPLVAVGDLLMTGGVLPVHAVDDAHVSPPPMSPRRRGVKKGAAVLLVSLFLIPFFLIMHEAIGLPGEFALFGVIGAIGAILRIIFAALFEDGAPRTSQFAPPQQHYTPPRINPVAQEMLPSAQSTPVNNYRQPQVNTSEIMHPPSVTDHTTRLLEKQSDPSER
ncbi:MAG: hypothetical protein LC747_01825 [Acidobacteria bacterium]|nr:hypothetical protein [Acidobacteriota bacterium]